MLFALLLLSTECHIAVIGLFLFLTVPWVGQQCVIVVFPGHTRLLFLVATDSSIGYSKTCIKRPLKNRQSKDLNDKW